MARLDRRKWRAIARTTTLGSVLGLAGGYAVFYSVFPLASVPASSEASIPFILVVVLFTSVLVGLATENLVELIFQVFIGLFLSGAFASVMALSPSLLGIVYLAPDSVPAFLFQYGFPIFLLAFVVDFIGGTAGLWLRERYFIRGTQRTSTWAERK